MTQIHSDARVARVTLTTAYLNAAITFYRNVLGLSVLKQFTDSALMGVGSDGFLELRERTDARANPHATGLYHFAVLVPTRQDLGNALTHLRRVSHPLQGAADHLVSEALYLADGEGNGIEIYRDRPRAEWPGVRGQIRMDTLPLDLHDLLSAANDRNSDRRPSGTTLGHIHLRVSDIGRAESFYRDLLGFTLTWRLGQDAAFFGAGGYHHHIGVNTWGTRDAQSAPEGSLGLHSYTIALPSETDLEQTVARLRNGPSPVHGAPAGYTVRDPAGIQVVLTGRPLSGLA